MPVKVITSDISEKLGLDPGFTLTYVPIMWLPYKVGKRAQELQAIGAEMTKFSDAGDLVPDEVMIKFFKKLAYLFSKAVISWELPGITEAEVPVPKGEDDYELLEEFPLAMIFSIMDELSSDTGDIPLAKEESSQPKEGQEDSQPESPVSLVETQKEASSQSG